VLERLRSLFRRPEPTGPPESLRSFGPADRPITESGVSIDEDAWRVDAGEAGSIRLFELSDSSLESCLLTYRAELKTADVEGGAYLELWCRFPGRGEFFSKGLHQKARGSTGWSEYEVPFTLRAGEQPDLIRLNVAFEGSGTVWLRNVELLRTPMR
jgi:hypothetical protein